MPWAAWGSLQSSLSGVSAGLPRSEKGTWRFGSVTRGTTFRRSKIIDPPDFLKQLRRRKGRLPDVHMYPRIHGQAG